MLASASLASSRVDDEVGAATDFVSVAFASPAPVKAGMAYAIVLLAPGAGDCGGPLAYYEWQLGADNPYPTGAAFFSTNGGTTFPAFGTTDGAFRTYVDLDPPETSITRDVKRSETGNVRFRFESDEVGATFECKLKGKNSSESSGSSTTATRRASTRALTRDATSSACERSMPPATPIRHRRRTGSGSSIDITLSMQSGTAAPTEPPRPAHA